MESNVAPDDYVVMAGYSEEYEYSVRHKESLKLNNINLIRFKLTKGNTVSSQYSGTPVI